KSPVCPNYGVAPGQSSVRGSNSYILDSRNKGISSCICTSCGEGHGKWQDQWLDHPFPTMSEPEKAVAYLTDLGDYDEDHQAWLYNKASLHSVDSFFNQVRRRLSLLERPIHSKSNKGRIWNGYSPYNPGNVAKVLDIVRTVHNILTAKDGKTPAERLGLAHAPLDHEDIIYFSSTD
ncbi:MAG: hypothetical protein ACREV4_14215, partial [Gammaproteobacteria bacterium]